MEKYFFSLYRYNTVYGSILSISLHVFAVITCSWNTVSLIWHVRNLHCFDSVLHCSLNIADIVLVVYVCIIILFDHLYEGNVAYISLAWKRTIWCKTAGTVLMISVLLSNVSTMFIGIDRFIAIRLNPYMKWKKFNWPLLICFLIGCMLGILTPCRNIFRKKKCLHNGGTISFSWIFLDLCML